MCIRDRNHNIKAGKIAVADLNGDGIYDYIIRTPEKNVDPGMPGTLDGSTSVSYTHLLQYSGW